MRSEDKNEEIWIEYGDRNHQKILIKEDDPYHLCARLIAQKKIAKAHSARYNKKRQY